MKLAIFCLWVTCPLFHSGSQYLYQDAINDVYCDKGKKYFSVNVDDNQVLHVDFEDKAIVDTLPDFVNVTWEKYYGLIYAYAYNEMKEFQDDMEPMARELGYPPEVKEPPVSAVYSREEVLLGSENTLICYVTRFYPPQITIRWMRNNENVTQGVSLSQIYANNDGSFNQISTLKFTPKKDDVYFCTVEHSALDEPLTREWDVEVSEPSLGPSVFCGVGLAVGLLGVATGTFLLVKGKDSRRHLGV
ncbi:H-2 class II histocompatibility antigen, A-Q alpha chain-like isoform X1 [Sardina pilchardus]|uniref:H-2 class II histocompatibility antigen, A-Q alpha chain-like isoform X1 n=1 Tax=Sardina pilchardus TaxID=27697 RepID=UPI002E1016F0